MTDQMGFFDPPKSEEEIRPGSPEQWIDRVNRGLCAKCAAPRGEPHPDAHLAVNSHLKNQLCRACWETDKINLEARLAKLDEIKKEIPNET